jgi:hypothetical protein
MNKQQIYKQSKLISEFMGFKTHTDAVDDRTLAYYVGDVIKADNSANENEDDVFHPEDMQFHTSWDWLMPVVNECYHNGADENEVGDITHGLLDCDIDHTYEAIVEFIKQHKL